MFRDTRILNLCNEIFISIIFSQPEITIEQNAVEVRISRERVITDDKVPWKKKNKDYRE